MTSALGQEGLDRVTGTLGNALAEFTLNARLDGLSVTELTDTQAAYVLQLDSMLAELNRMDSIDSDRAADLLRAYVTGLAADSEPPAMEMHLACGGTFQMPALKNDSDAAIAALARDLYPAFLLPIEKFSEYSTLGAPDFRSTAALHRHAANRDFQRAVLTDQSLSKLFRREDPHMGRVAVVYRTTGQGGQIQLSTLAELPLRTVWRERVNAQPPNLSDFIQRSVEVWHIIKSALTGVEQEIRLRVGLAGVLPPNDEPIEFGDITIRRATEFEWSLSPENLKGRLGGTDAQRNTVEINYEGDLIAEMQHPYVAKIVDTLESRPHEFFTSDAITGTILRLRTALILAATRTHRIQIVPTIYLIDDPLSHGFANFGDARQTFNLVPTLLTEGEVASWIDWYHLLSDERVDKLRLATTRIMRAIGERSDPVDVLIDSVIAWENIFGSKEGEPTLRVTASLALLLEEDYQARRKLRTKLGKIYTLRSDAVHGTAMPTVDEYALCNEALDIAIQALRAILTQRSDLLDERTSTERSLRMILGVGNPDGKTSSD